MGIGGDHGTLYKCQPSTRTRRPLWRNSLFCRTASLSTCINPAFKAYVGHPAVTTDMSREQTIDEVRNK